MLETDILIVGAGSAGSTLAGRLSERSDLHVTLAEAGQRSNFSWLKIPIGYFKTVGHTEHDWRFETEADPAMANRKLPWPRGKGLGGSSLINGMLYLRGHQADYDQWAAEGNPGWDWASVLPLFKRSQGRKRSSGTPGPTDGQHGPLTVSDLPRDELSDAFIAAASQTGIPPTADFNTGDNKGAGYFQMTVERGERMSSARAFLRKRANLDVRTGMQATRILFEGKRAVGVEFIHQGKQVTIRARKEVILCAGAIQSPQLLMLSGIGDPADLQPLGIEMVHASPQVGRNLQDHLQVRPSYKCRDVETLNDIANSLWRSAREYVKYKLFKSGALAWGVYRAGAFFKLGEQAQWPDVQIHFGLISFDRPHQPPHPFPGITLSACMLRPYSRGELKLKSANPLEPVAIHAGYLSDERDQQLAVAMVRKMQAIAAAAPLAKYIVTPNEPAAHLQSDAEILEWVRQRSGSIFHPVGTCAMGPDGDPKAVLDSRLKVRGVEGLRVVDGSAMPTIVSGNTNAPIIMMAERASDFILEDFKS